MVSSTGQEKCALVSRRKASRKESSEEIKAALRDFNSKQAKQNCSRNH